MKKITREQAQHIEAMKAAPEEAEKARLKAFANELRRWWSFDDYQKHTHSWHDRENFIEKILPSLIAK